MVQPDAVRHQRYARSIAAFERACQVMPGGVNSPVRAYRSVGMSPISIARGEGCRVTDVDGHSYIDYVGSYGPLILGHADPQTLQAVTKAAEEGFTFGMPGFRETLLAEMVVEAVPSIDVVRMVNSGTEAAMSAIRLARAATGRSKIIKCTGCYHGHSDALLVQAGSGATTLGVPSSPGVPEAITAGTVLVPFNDLDAVEQAMRQHKGEIACMAVEPIAGNMGCIPPGDGYLQGLRDLCDRYDVLLLFDEVMTGFRVAYGGAQARYRVTPDLTCLGKVIGGGLPVGAYGGHENLMRKIAPDGPVYQAGTLSGNPLAMAAGIAQLRQLKDGKAYDRLEASGARLEAGLWDAIARTGAPASVSRVGSMITLFFRQPAPASYEEATTCDTEAFGRFFRAMLDRGVVLPPSQYEAWFVSTAHDEQAIDQTIDIAREALAEAMA